MDNRFKKIIQGYKSVGRLYNNSEIDAFTQGVIDACTFSFSFDRRIQNGLNEMMVYDTKSICIKEDNTSNEDSVFAYMKVEHVGLNLEVKAYFNDSLLLRNIEIVSSDTSLDLVKLKSAIQRSVRLLLCELTSCFRTVDIHAIYVYENKERIIGRGVSLVSCYEMAEDDCVRGVCDKNHVSKLLNNRKCVYNILKVNIDDLET